MSKTSKLLNCFREYSTRVFGGLPHSVHCNTPPQSPVWHEPLPLLSKLQFVRPHTRPSLELAGMLIVQFWPWSSRWPPPTGVAAAHTGPVVQQYCDPPKVVQGLLHPPGTLRTSGHWPTISAAHEIAWHLSAPGLVGAKLMGTLKPSTLEMSKKSSVEPLAAANWGCGRPNGVAAVVINFKFDGGENNPIISGSSIASGSAGGIIQRQYSGVLKVVQGLLHPPGSLRGAGHSPMISAVHEIARHVSVVLVGLKLMGMLNPSTSEMSKKSMWLNWFVVNSAMVYGDFPPIEHIIPPQSPV
nr:hypothetical protein KK1_011842 [Ipomoea batatas]